MRTQLGRLIRDIERKIDGDPARMEAIASVLERARIIHGQKPGETQKLYAFHAPEVECIGNRNPFHSRSSKIQDEISEWVGLTGQATIGFIVGNINEMRELSR